MIELVISGQIFEGPRFQDTPQALRRLNDIALSGDGEPTTYTNFGDVVSSAPRCGGAISLPS